VARPQENGSCESAHGHLKRPIKQHLLLRPWFEENAWSGICRVQFADLAVLKIGLPSGSQMLMSRGDIFSSIAGLHPSLLQSAILLEARIDLKIAAKRRLVPVILNPHRDKVSGLHLDDAIEPWLAERGFSNDRHESFFLESA